jgi:hypothetical protein
MVGEVGEPLTVLPTAHQHLVHDNGMSNKNKEHKYNTDISLMNFLLLCIPYWP